MWQFCPDRPGVSRGIETLGADSHDENQNFPFDIPDADSTAKAPSLLSSFVQLHKTGPSEVSETSLASA